MPSGHLFLVGYRGSGKSTVGRHLATLLNRPFSDTDRLIEENAGQSIVDLFRLQGEQAFRDLESAAIEQIPPNPDQVIALGGGAVLRESNQKRIRQMGRVVWLKADPAVLGQRIAADSQRGAPRPSLSGDDPALEVQKILAIREPIYRSVCDWALETTSQSPEEIAKAIAAWYASPANQA